MTNDRKCEHCEHQGNATCSEQIVYLHACSHCFDGYHAPPCSLCRPHLQSASLQHVVKKFRRACRATKEFLSTRALCCDRFNLIWKHKFISWEGWHMSSVYINYYGEIHFEPIKSPTSKRFHCTIWLHFKMKTSQDLRRELQSGRLDLRAITFLTF